MSTEVRSSLVDDLTAFTARLDGLRPDQHPDDLSSTLRVAFQQPELYDAHTSFLVTDVERTKALLEVFDKALTATKHDAKIFKRFWQLCGRTGLLPASHILSDKPTRTSEHPLAPGGFGDVWESTYNDKRVAIKVLRAHKEDDVQGVKKAFCRGVVMWRRISHLNIVPFLGVSEAPAPLSVVSEWMPNGNVRDYVVKNPETSRLQLLLDISCGLSFLHSCGIIHGGLRGDSVLIDESGAARLGGFGFTNIASLIDAEAFASRFEEPHRWIAPELFNVNKNGKSVLSTRKSDVFALGMVTIEVFTGQVPFSEIKTSAAVAEKIIDGERPPRPPKGKKLGLSDEFWGIIRSSLARKAEERPLVSTFVGFLEKATPDIAVLKELVEFDANSEEHVKKLHSMFEYGDHTLLGMREEETLIVIEVFDRVLKSSLDDSTFYSRCLHGLQKISARCGLLPMSYWISHGSFAETSSPLSTTGVVSETRQWLIDGKLVAIKMINSECVEDFDALKRKLCTNAIKWKRLRHPNVMKFLGFRSGCPPFSLVYPWMSNGNLSEYLREHPNVDKLGLLLDVVRGLAHLHRHNLIHGNLTGHNILVDGNGVACVSEYGLEIALRDEASSERISTNFRWMAPELLNIKPRRVPSRDSGKAADVYSLGIVMFEILTNTTPFMNEISEGIVDKIVMGLRPEWPSNNPSQGLVDELWEQTEVCWNQEPDERPTVSRVLQTLQVLSGFQCQGTMASVEDSDDTAIVGEREQVEDSPDVYSTHEGREERDNSDVPSGGTPVSSSTLSDPTRSHRSEKYTPGSDRLGHRIRAEIEKYFLHLLRYVLAVTIGRCELVVGEPTLGTKTICRRVQKVVGCDQCVPYAVSRPIPRGKTLRKVIITIVSKDQGWSAYEGDQGTYRNSWTWFELSVGPPSKDSGEKWRGEVVRNLHAHGDFMKHTIEMLDRELYEKAESGDVLTVWALAKFSGWENTVKKVKIQYVVSK